MAVWVGTSGWQYRDWRGAFYPRELAQSKWLEHYADGFRTVEVNNTFYRLPEAGVFDDWARRTPADFVMALKMSRFLTHLKRLKDPLEPIELFLSRASRLGGKLGPVLVQVPPQMKKDVGRLDVVLELLAPRVRVAFEPRDASWLAADVRSVLARHDAALCLVDSPRYRSPICRTANWGYVRFHEGAGTPPPRYEAAALRRWAERLAAEWEPREDVYAFFNNDTRCCAVRDAIRFAGALEGVGLVPSRVPDATSLRRAP